MKIWFPCISSIFYMNDWRSCRERRHFSCWFLHSVGKEGRPWGHEASGSVWISLKRLFPSSCGGWDIKTCIFIMNSSLHVDLTEQIMVKFGGGKSGLHTENMALKECITFHQKNNKAKDKMYLETIFSVYIKKTFNNNEFMWILNYANPICVINNIFWCHMCRK